MNKDILRKLPSVDRTVNMPEAVRLAELYSRDVVVEEIRVVLEQLRNAVREGDRPDGQEENPTPDWVLGRVTKNLEERLSSSLSKAVNATGVILHTGLGRAVLPDTAIKAVTEVIGGYCTLAVDRESGKRGHRDSHLNDLICTLTGAEAATVVNNNAAATMLILNTLAKGKEVILSRGQLVEIGGSFRMPDVMEASGALLREVGTTNKTHLRDYADAINEDTGAIMRVHHSNYRILGFAAEPDIAELADLAHRNNLPVIDDLGSGALLDLAPFQIEAEPLVKTSLAVGADVACFSGDKLIGGPQAGIIVGRASIIQQIRQNPLTRALRVGKMTIICLDAALRQFLHPEKITSNHPVYRMFSLGLPEITRRAGRLKKKLNDFFGNNLESSLIKGYSQVGSGSAPIEKIPTKLLRISTPHFPAEQLAKKLRSATPPVFTRIQQDAVLLDLRTVQTGEEAFIIRALKDCIPSQG